MNENEKWNGLLWAWQQEQGLQQEQQELQQLTTGSELFVCWKTKHLKKLMINLLNKINYLVVVLLAVVW